VPNATTIIPVPGLNLPAIYAGSPSSSEVVIVLHGLGVSKETQIPELQRLKGQGFFAVAVDAPHHGEREDGYLGVMQLQKTPFEKHLFLLKIIWQQACEVAAMIKFYRDQRKKVAVVGISMGGFAAFALLNGPVLPDFCAPFLASPDFSCPERPADLPLSCLEKSGPAHALKEVPDCDLFMVNAGSDEVISETATADFFATLKSAKGFDANRIQYHTYAESQHFMRPADWYDAWEKLNERLSRLC